LSRKREDREAEGENRETPALPAESKSPGMPRSVQRFGIASALCLLCLVCYLANRRTVPYNRGFDTIPVRLLPFSILRYQTLTLEPFRQDFFRERRHAGFTLERRGRLVSGYPIGASFLALPFYFPYYVDLALKGKTSHSDLFARAEFGENSPRA